MDEARKRGGSALNKMVDESEQGQQPASEDVPANPSKMKVRVVLRPDQMAAAKAETHSLSDPKPVYYEYRKDRIFLAVISALLIFGGILFMAYRLIGINSSASGNVAGPEELVQEFSGSAAHLDDKRALNSSETAVETAASSFGFSQPVIDTGNTKVANKYTNEGVNNDANLSAKTVSLGPRHEDDRLNDHRSGSELSGESTATAQHSEKPVTEANKLDENSGPGNPQVSVFNGSVVRASLNWRVVDLEPGRVVNVSPVVFEKGDSIKRIFFYTQLDDHKNNIFYYEWFLNDQSEAKVKIGVWSNRWRSYSSKQILRKQVGDWRVELKDAAGQVFARAAFVVRATP
jgi:hypothetical protein